MKRSPISLAMTAASVASHLKYGAAVFKPARAGSGPSWDGHGGNITASAARTPLTPPSYWEGRWALCPLTIRNEDGKTMYFPDACTMVNRENRIVQTQVTGMDGTVKEYVGHGDWQISLQLGIQSSTGGEIMDEYPSDELGRTLEMLDDSRILRVHSAFLEIFGIDRIVVRGCSATQATESNYQGITVSALSDGIYELTSKEY